MAEQMKRRKERCWLYERLAAWRAGRMDNAWMDDRWTDEHMGGRKDVGQMDGWIDNRLMDDRMDDEMDRRKDAEYVDT